MQNLNWNFRTLLVLLVAYVPWSHSSLAAELPVNGVNRGFIAAELQAVDALVQAFMNETETPGLSIAFSFEGRLVMQRSYGYADIERREEVLPKHRFRIASISKPITAVAIAKLVEQGKLAWHSKVFGQAGQLGTRYGAQPYHLWLKNLTVDHLLTHTAGAWGNSHNDPMFRNGNWSMSQLIDHTLNTDPHDSVPGVRYDYSNFGYALLGRIIEQRTGLSYEKYVQRHILAPMGVFGMSISGNTLRDRQRDEVRYYPASAAYAMNVARMDAHGGWIASPAELLRFLSFVDGFDTVPDQLQPEVREHLFTPAYVNENYARGWSVNQRPNYWHSGSLPGSSSILVRAHDGFGWAAVSNSRPVNPAERSKLDRLMWDIKQRISQWPPGARF